MAILDSQVIAVISHDAQAAVLSLSSATAPIPHEGYTKHHSNSNVQRHLFANQKDDVSQKVSATPAPFPPLTIVPLMVESDGHTSPTKELPPSFFQPLDELSFSELFFNQPNHATRRRTETFSSFPSGFAMEGEPRGDRIRASSLSIPHHAFAKAFGPSLFTSDWGTVQNAIDSPEPLVNQEMTFVDDTSDNAVLTTLDYLGLDDPLQKTRKQKEEPRSRSISFSYTLNPNTPLDKGELFGNLNVQIPNQASEPKEEEHESPQDESGHQDHHVPSRSLWIGNIDSNLGQEELFNIFSPFGSIESIRMLPDKECAFINYAHVEDAIRAREDMQGGRVGNCIIRIGYGKSDTAHDTQGMQPTKSLWIGNISPNMKPSDLEAVFTPFGQVESARVLTHKNCGFVNFVHLEDAITARAELNGQEVSGNIIKIGFAKVPTKQESSTSVTSSSTDYQSPEGSPWRNTSPNRPPASMAHRQSSFSRSFNEVPPLPEPPQYSEVYATAIPPIPEPNPNRKADQNRLREIRKRLEGHCSNRELDTIFSEIIDDAVDLCSDYIGNVVIQKVVEKCNDAQRQRLIDTVGPHLAALGIHKNGTWAVQKIIECARTPSQMESIANALKQYTPPLLLDQFGNYVVQCCLRLSGQKNQFVFDAMCNKCWDLGQGRFGARAIRTCLESQFTTKRQQKEVSNSILHYCVQLSMNPNGNILVTWLMELSSLPGRYRALASKMAPHVALLSCHKLASTSILKLVNQRLEMDAREQVIKEIFLKERNLQQIMADHAHGVGVIQKILSAGCVSPEERTRLADLVRLNCHRMDENHIGYKRLMEELASIPRETQELTPQSSPKRHEPIRQHSQNRLRQ